MDQPSSVNEPVSPSMPPVTPQAKSPLMMGVVGAVVLAAVVGGAAYMRKNSVMTPDADDVPTTGSVNPGATGTALSSYKDGTFTANGVYQTHVGPEEVTITVTLKDGVITDTTFAGTPAAQMSKRYMDMFGSNYKTMVVGKNINDVHLGKVSGSSLTPIGFNNALDKIKQQAGQSS